MKPAIIEDKIFEFEPFEENGSVLLAAEASWRGMADELQELHYLKGAKFINQLKLIIYYGEYHLVEGETNIYSAISEQSDDNPGTLARSIKRYFELNLYAREVLVYKGKKQISVTRKSLEDTNFFRTFIRRYTKWQKESHEMTLCLKLE